jgi:hypothetical protein
VFLVLADSSCVTGGAAPVNTCRRNRREGKNWMHGRTCSRLVQCSMKWPQDGWRLQETLHAAYATSQREEEP